jgi:hypothetical protein
MIATPKFGPIFLFKLIITLCKPEDVNIIYKISRCGVPNELVNTRAMKIALVNIVFDTNAILLV